ncbi:hypothetical protein D068_cds38260 [Bacillus atrophaeus UCMB-5137]|nr:hypothetical protein D068_cds38260 [Bacillus atrophaeus UCMB-5137]
MSQRLCFLNIRVPKIPNTMAERNGKTMKNIIMGLNMLIR